MTNSNISKFNRLVMGVAAAALIAASCGSDEPTVVEPVEPVPVETTTAPTTAPSPVADIEEPATGEDASPTVEQAETPATTTTAAEPDSIEEASIEETPSAVIEDEPADELVPDGSDTGSEGTDAPVGGVAGKALAFLASDLGVPESEIALTETKPIIWSDTSLGCPREGYAYAQVETPGFRFTFSHGTASHDVHTDEQGTHIVRPVDCYDPTSSAEPAVEPEEETEEAPEPAVEQEEAPESEPETAPEQEPVSGPVTEPESSDAIICSRSSDGAIACPQTIPDDYQCDSNDDGMVCRPPGSEPEPEPDSESETAQQPEQDTSGDIVCPRNTDGTVSCPEEIPDDYRCENVDESMVCHPPGWEPEPDEPVTTVQESDIAWTAPVAGVVPDVHPGTPLSEWQRGPVDPTQRAYDKPRPTEIVVGWTNWCSHQNAVSCRFLLHTMKQALDYLGAHPQCVLNVFTERVNYHVDRGASANFSYAREAFGWHLCATVIDPIVYEIPSESRQHDVGLRLSDTPGITLAERCRIVLTDPFPDIQLESRHRGASNPPRSFRNDCNAWASWVIENGAVVNTPACNASSHLAEEWMEHHHNQHERYFRPHC